CATSTAAPLKHSAICAIPALPGEQNNCETSGLCFNFQQSACSRPPPPITSTFIDLIHHREHKGHRDFIWKSSPCPLRTLWFNYKSVVAFVVVAGKVGEARV